ncbi:MAG: oligosaccharide flippase family protein [Rhodospirillales bacterium]|nr:oligosaccharide flippase family protein [Rhodospirillales bacterium]
MGEGRPASDPAPVLPEDGPPPDTLIARTARGMGWVVGWRAMTRLLGLISPLMLMRLLAPADFGLVALGTGFVLAVDALSFIGVEDAVVRERDPDRDCYDTAFTLNAARGAITALAVAAAAPAIAAFFKEPRLANVLYALALSALLGGAENVGILQFRRDLAFHKEFQMMIAPRLIGIVAAIGTALAFRSYWALVVGILTNRVLHIVMTYTMHPHRPRLTLRRWRDMTGFSLGTWLVSLALLLRDRSDNFVIGRMLGPTSVSYLALGSEIGLMPVLELAMPLCRALYSSFAMIRNDGGKVDAIYARFAASTLLLVMPACIGLALVAGPLVRLAVGAQWLPVIPLIAISGLAGPSIVFGLLSRTLLEAYGQLAVTFWLIMAFWVVRLGAVIAATRQYGLIGGVGAAALVMLVEQGAGTALACRRFAIAPADLVRRMWRIGVATAAMAAAVWASALARGDRLPPVLALAAASALGAAVYTLVLLALWQASGRPDGAERDALRILRRVAARLAQMLGHRARLA